MRKLFYMGLEPYQERYTLQLTDWNQRVFTKRGVDHVLVLGETLTTDQSIVTGQVLDAHGRTYFSMTQLANLVKMMKEGQVTSEDVIYFEDMFTPGIESLPYILNQVDSSMRPRIFVRCLAQSIDPDDFVHVWGMSKWMGLYEKMVCELVRDSGGAILASNEEMVMHMKVAGWDCPIYNISGLAFGKEEVRERVDHKIKPWADRACRVVFAARFDQEKQPGFFMDLVEEWHARHPDYPVEFALLSGGPLRSNNQTYLRRAALMTAAGKLRIYKNLSKNEYYNILNDSRVLINTALQDWVSNTVSEADALGCNVLYPAYRSFPETFANDHTRLYVPWSLDDAMVKLKELLSGPHVNMGKISDWTNGTIDRIIDIIDDWGGEQWSRNDRNYRDHTRESKYSILN